MRKNRKLFDLLGVSPADDMTTIRMAWRAKVRALHPDLAGDKALATERLAEVNAAFDALQGHMPKPSMRPKAANAARPKVEKTPQQPKRTPRPNPKVERWAGCDPSLTPLYRRAVAGYAQARQNVKAA
ncbi:MAG: J domain-containing protein [Paracoccaceae bacterium]